MDNVDDDDDGDQIVITNQKSIEFNSENISPESIESNHDDANNNNKSDINITENNSFDTDANNNNNNNNNNIDEHNNNTGHSLVPCSLCGRKFHSERLDKHVQICQRLKEKKRKLFDSVKQRAENLDKINNYPTELINTGARDAKAPAGATKGAEQSRTAKNTSKKAKNWRKQHQEFVQTIRAARGEVVTGAETADTDGTSANNNSNKRRSKSLPPGLVECPTCGRRFSERAAERHLVWCADKLRKEQQQDKQKNQEALERMKARTKYKPPSLVTNGSTNPATTRSRSRSVTRTVANRTVSPQSGKSVNVSTKTDSSTNNISRKYTKNISRSTENLRTRTRSNRSTENQIDSKHVLPTANKPNGSSTITKRTTDRGGGGVGDSGKHLSTVNRDTPSNRTIVIRKNTKASVSGRSSGGGGGGAAYSMSRHVTSKIDSGLNPSSHRDSNSSSRNGVMVAGKKSAPVMKFKEKFPNHQHHRSNTMINSNLNQLDYETILCRNSSTTFDDSPKTVPGVRTGGISPVKGANTTANANDRRNLSRSDTNLHNIGDIKKRIDMYISGLTDNQVWNSYGNTMQRYWDDSSGAAQGNNATEPSAQQEELMMISMMMRQGEKDLRVERQHSVNSDEARGSTSDSTDSGLGVVFNGMGTGSTVTGNSVQLETVTECDGVKLADQVERTSRRGSGVRYKHALTSPPMSDVERNSGLSVLVRNSSLNDLHLLDSSGRTKVAPSPPPPEIIDSQLIAGQHYYSSDQMDDDQSQGLPRFCHQCGTKYPNTLAKFCYECGNRRFGAVM